jgi:cobalamin biosynthesis Mg chelatase CobN
VITLSGIFRDLLPLQTRMLAEAALLAASADEPADMNFVRKHTLAYQAEHGCDLETAALRVFSNAEGAYGSNVNLLVDNSRWEDEGELADTYTVAQVLRLRRRRQGRSAVRAARQHARRRADWPTRTSIPSKWVSPPWISTSTPSAVSAAP